ncbi:hypothetical protein OOT00_05405 [Desulfobotulus sp. H1]|uniref:Transposase n=1 Tax=Desulfobotulus pelophilus TaxID=2823377 RepID=A0ABT3N8R6_9BACT|nr:hypothetical protein [Desulfobotulus pelophilus]MCW7753422.1 hypothetical protein [Desulfobotulus pelophilus]
MGFCCHFTDHQATIETTIGQDDHRPCSDHWTPTSLQRPLDTHFITRKANQEEGISGRFWEGRFKSQALLDEKAILAAMAYVDLNPVRAGMAEIPEDSE